MHQHELEDFGRRMESRGFGCSQAAYFAATGVFVFAVPVPSEGDRGITVVERGVHVYPSDRGWIARIALHGGAGWTRCTESLAALEDVVLEALRAEEIPPTRSWNAI